MVTSPLFGLGRSTGHAQFGLEVGLCNINNLGEKLYFVTTRKGRVLRIVPYVISITYRGALWEFGGWCGVVQVILRGSRWTSGVYFAFSS